MTSMSPYRGGELAELPCPRCKKTKLPPLDVAPCSKCGGMWVTAFAATEVLEDLRPDPVTRWWRVREPCPDCGDKMTLYGAEPGLFQGCELHGYFIDADTVEHTKLGRGIDHAALERKRADRVRVDAEREDREKKASLRAAERAEIERRQAELDRKGLVREVYVPEAVVAPEVYARRQAEFLRRALVAALGSDATDLLLQRIRELEARVAELEKR